MARVYKILIECDSEGCYVASIPELQGCHARARTMDRLMEKVREAIRSRLELEGAFPSNEFIGIQHLPLPQGQIRTKRAQRRVRDLSPLV